MQRGPEAAPDGVTVVILTLNEAIHIARAVDNAKRLTDEVVIVDSGSTDDTCGLAAARGAQVFFHAFQDYGDQRQWALTAIPYGNDWVLFLDADELLSDELIEEIRRVLPGTPPEVDGYRMRRRFYWLGKWLRRGGLYPLWLLRLVRRERAWCEDRTVNEHLLVSGQVRDLRHDIFHVDLKPISDWLAKHNTYSSLEAREHLRRPSRGGGARMARGFWGRRLSASGGFEGISWTAWRRLWQGQRSIFSTGTCSGWAFWMEGLACSTTRFGTSATGS